MATINNAKVLADAIRSVVAAMKGGVKKDEFVRLVKETVDKTLVEQKIDPSNYDGIYGARERLRSAKTDKRSQGKEINEAEFMQAHIKSRILDALEGVNHANEIMGNPRIAYTTPGLGDSVVPGEKPAKGSASKLTGANKDYDYPRLGTGTSVTTRTNEINRLAFNARKEDSKDEILASIKESAFCALVALQAADFASTDSKNQLIEALSEGFDKAAEWIKSPAFEKIMADDSLSYLKQPALRGRAAAKAKEGAGAATPSGEAAVEESEDEETEESDADDSKFSHDGSASLDFDDEPAPQVASLNKPAADKGKSGKPAKRKLPQARLSP